MLEDRNVLEHFLQGLADQVEFAGLDPKREDLFIAFSPKEPKAAEYARMIGEGVEEPSWSGELAAILKRYSSRTGSSPVPFAGLRLPGAPGRRKAGGRAVRRRTAGHRISRPGSRPAPPPGPRR